MADAANRTGRPLVISTEPFSLVPTPLQGEFSHMYRTTNDVEGSYSSNLSEACGLHLLQGCNDPPVSRVADRLDLNANWWRLVGPGRWADPDCIMCGHFGIGPIAEAQCRSVFAVFAVTKSPLLLGAQIWNFTAGAFINAVCTPAPLLCVASLCPTETLATVGNAGLIAVNQDSLGVPARKLAAASGRVSPFYVGLAPCTTANTEPGVNGVTAADLRWAPQALNATAAGVPNGSVALLHVASGRCLATRTYLKGPTIVPVLLPCNTSDATQAWLLPLPLSVTHVINVEMNLSLAAVSASAVTVHSLLRQHIRHVEQGATTVWGAPHHGDNITLLDAAYGRESAL